MQNLLVLRRVTMDDNFVLDRIEELCKMKGLSHYRLALKSGVHQSSLSTLMNRKSTPNVYTLDKICKGLDMTLAQFFSVDDEFANLTDAQKKFLITWNSLPEEERKLTMAYMEGLIDEINLAKKGE